MKYTVLTLVLTVLSTHLYGLQSQYQGDFRRRFGSNSTIYKLPVLFSRPHMNHPNKRKSKTRNHRSTQKKIHMKHEKEMKKFRNEHIKNL